MADFARATLTIAGGYFFGPVGALAGGLLGSYLFPTQLPDVKGPRIKELSVQRSTVGAALPIVYGTQKLPGNINWWSDLIEEENSEEVGGKGGGSSQTVTNYEYYLDFSVIICDGEDGRPSKPQGIRRIWAYGDIIYDLTPQRDDETDANYAARIATSEQTAALMTIRPGDEDQLPSELKESYEGAGNVPAERGYYIVEFEHFPLNKYGKVLPQLFFEVYTDGTSDDVDCSQYSAGVLYPWVEGTTDPRDSRNSHEYAGDAGFSAWDADISDGLATLESRFGRPFLAGGLDDEYIHGWSTSSTPGGVNPCTPFTSDDRVELYLSLNSLPITGVCDGEIPDTGSLCSSFEDYFGIQAVVWWNGDWAGHSNQGRGFWVRILDGESESSYFGGYSQAGSFACGSPAGTLQLLSDQELAVRRSLVPPSGCAGGTPLANAPGYCVIDGVVMRAINWEQVGGSWHVLRAYDDDGTYVTAYPVGPARPSTHAEYNDQDFWEAAYAADQASDDPQLPGGLTYPADYPEDQSFGFVGTCETESVEVACVSVADIIEDLCDRAGLTTVDVSDIQSCLYGYTANTRPGMLARDALVPLRTYGLFDVLESVDGSGLPILKFIERGAASAETLSADDLRAHVYGSDAPSAVEVTRVQEKDMPRRVVVHFLDIDRDHEPGEQSASRITTEAEKEVHVELPISMSSDSAAQLADIYLTEAYVGRNTYRFSLDNQHLEREPTDCVEIPVDGETERVRITAVAYSIGGLLRFEAVRDDDQAYLSTAGAIPHEGSGSEGVAPGLLVCPSEAVLLDLPRLRPEHTDAGFYAAIYGTCSSWECAALYRSPDGGTTYGKVAVASFQATVGEIEAFDGSPTGASETPGTGTADYDIDNTITVRLLSPGDLSSVSDAQINAGFNAAAIGVDGRWLIIQFKTVELQTDGSYVLSDLLWGLNDTDENMGTTEVGDTFVLLNESLLRIPETAANIDVERQYKVVTCGESLDDATAFGFATGGLSYLPPLSGGGPIIVDPDDNTVDFDPTVDLDNNARVGVRKNSADPTYERRRLNFIEGSGVTITVADDSGNEEVDITIDATGSSVAAWKEPVRAASTGSNVDISTDLENGDSLDGVTLATGDRVLLKDQSTGSQNGIYIVVASGAASRSSDADAGSELVGAAVFVSEGTTNADRIYLCTTNAPITVGATSLTFAQITAGVTDHGALSGLSDDDHPQYQLDIQFKDEGSNEGSAGGVTTVDFVGAGVTANESGGTLTVTVPGSGGVTQNVQTGNYTLVLGDAGLMIYRDTGSAATWTIPANASVAFPVGTLVLMVNDDADTNITVAITSDTLRYSPGGATGSRTILPYGRLLLEKVSSTGWKCSGSGVY
jgi:hypothetical protein